MVSNVLSKHANFSAQCPFKKKQKKHLKNHISVAGLICNYSCFWKVHQLVLLERLCLDNNIKLILNGMLRSRLQNQRNEQLARSLQIHFFSHFIILKLSSTKTCVTNIVFVYMCSQMMIVFLVEGTVSAILLRAKCIQWKIQLIINLLSNDYS